MISSKALHAILGLPSIQIDSQDFYRLLENMLLDFKNETASMAWGPRSIKDFH
jgi:hypothetical protein